MPIEIVEYDFVDDARVVDAVRIVVGGMPLSDKRRIKKYLKSENRRSKSFPPISPGMLRIDTLRSWPTRGRAIGMNSDLGHVIRLHARTVNDFSNDAVVALLGHELAHTYQWATGSEPDSSSAKGEAKYEQEADEIAVSWGCDTTLC